MPSYSISAPDGNTYTITGPEGASREEVIQEVLSQNPSAGTARTFGGYAKETLKAIPRGLIGGLETAATGAAALLPEEYEKPVVAKAQELAKRFSPQAAPGYEDSVPVKIGEGLGSMGSFLIPGGLPARALMAGAMGAGEARQRVQQEGATPEQISSATAQGILPGLTDLLPIQFLLGGVGKVALTGLVSRGVRAAATGSVEALQEASQNILQNAIAQGYKPEQGLYEGAGEAATYGGAVGAIAQGLIDLALPGRARRGQQPQRETAQTPPEVAPPEVQESIAPVAPKVGVEAPPKQSSWKEFIGTNPDKTALEARLEEVNGRLAWEEAQPKRNQFRINGLKTQRDTKIPEALAAVAAPGVAPQVDVTTLLKQKKVPPDEILNATGVRPDGGGTSDVQLVSPDESKKPGAEATDVARVGGAESTASGLTGGKEALSGAIKVPYEEVSIKDEETSVKVFNEYKKNQKGTTAPGTLNLGDKSIRISNRADPSKVEKFINEPDLLSTIKELDKTDEPILVTKVNGKNVIVDGHHRITAARAKGITELPVHFLTAAPKRPIKGFGAKKPKVEAEVEAPVIEAKVDKAYEPLKDQKEVEYYFTGKRGSIYAHHADGTTTAFREPSDMAGTGAKLQDRSVRTIYVQNPRVIAPGNAKTELRPSSKGKVARFFTEDYGPKKAGEMVPGTETSFTTTPSVGSSPVEVFKNGSVHFGSPITAVTPVEKAAAPVQGKINKAKLENRFTDKLKAASEAAMAVPKPIQTPKTVVEGTPDPKRLKRAAEYEQLKDAPKAAKDYYAHYGSIDESLKNLGFDLAEKTKKGEMGYAKEGGAPAQQFSDWIEKTGTPEQKVTLKKSQDEYAKLKSQAEDAVFVQRGVKQRDLEEAVREQLEREQRLAAETEFKQREREKANETENEAEADKADKDATAVSKTAEGVLQERATRKRKGEPIEKMETKADIERVIREANENEPEFSKGKAAAPTGNTKEDVTKALKNHFKEDSRFDALTTVVQSEADLPDEIRQSKDYRAGTRGVAYKNKVFLVADNIQRGRELGVFLHEAGAHIGFDSVMKPSDRQFLADQVRKWAKGKGDAVETVAAKAALAKGGKSNDEIIAYMTEELVNRGVKPTSFRPANTWLRRVVEAFKKVMNKLGLRQDITPQELVDFANGAAHIAMDTEIGQELAEFKRIATEVFDEPRFERGKATNWYKALDVGSFTEIDENGNPNRDWDTEKLRIGLFGPVNNAAIRLRGFISPTYSEIELVVSDENIPSSARYTNNDVVERFWLSYDKVVNQLSLGTSGIPDNSLAQQKYLDYTYTINDYTKFFNGLVGDKTTRIAIRTLRDKAAELGFLNKDTTLLFYRATGATAKNKPKPKILNYDQIMRFSQANPGLDNISARTLELASGPPAPQNIVQRAYQTALNPRPTKFMQNLRQNFANKNTWWEDWFSSLHGNNALNTAGEASALDRLQASTKTGGIQIATLEKGGFRKGANGLWEAYDTDASYKDIVEQVSKMVGKYKATPDFAAAQTVFNTAAIAKREEGLMASGQTTDTGGGIKRTFNDAQLREGLIAYNSSPEIREALRLYKKFNDRNVDTLITAGIIDASLAAELKGNSGYVPWFRFMQDANGDINIKAVKGFSRGLINLSKMQDLEGGKIEDVQIGNILDNMAKLSNWMVGKSIGNDTSAFMVDFAIPYGQAKRVGLPTAGGVDAKKTVQIMRNGIPTYYEMSDPAALPAFKGYEAAHGAIVSVLKTPADILRKTITLNPIFSLAQLPQDSFRAFAASGLNNPYAIFPRVMKNFMKELYGSTATGRELAKYGVVGKGSGMPTEASDNIRRQLGYYDKGAGGAWNRFIDGLERISSASDEAVRTALYELTLEEGGSPELALRRAREIINFDTQGAGATSSFLRQTVPFMGVWMNDLNNLYKGLVLGSARLSEGEKNATRAAIVYRGMQIAGLVTLYTLMVGDDDDYKKLDDDTRNRSLIVPGTGFRIPIPNDGIGFLFKVIPEEVTRAVMAQGIESDDAGAKMGRAIWNGFKNIGSFENLLPGAGSPLIKTPVELILNKSFYTGNPIVGKSKEFLAPAEQYTEGTSEIAKQLGAALNLSPIKLDYLVRGLTAQVGGSVLAASNSLFHAADGKVTPSWSGDIKDIPLLGQFGYSRKDKGDLEDYYELRHTVDKVARTYRDMIASGRGKEAIEYLTDPTNQKAFALRQLQTQIDKGLAQYRNMEKLIYNNPNLDSDEMRRQLDRVEEMRTKYLQSLRLPKLRAFAEISPSLDSSAFRILR